MLQCLSSAVPQCYSASVLQCLSAIVLLLKNAIELLFFYEVAYRQTEPLQEVLADLAKNKERLIDNYCIIWLQNYEIYQDVLELSAGPL